jgi:hypothetical protein
MADSYTLKAILSAVDKLSPVLKGVQGVAKTTRKYLGDVGTSINSLTSKFGMPLGILSTIAAGFGVAAIKKAVVAFADLGEEVQKGAFKAGMSNAEFQRMKYVAEQAGMPVELLGMSMGKLNKNLGSAGMGKNDNLVQLFKALHIPMRDANGLMRNGADLLPQLADAFVKNKDPVKQAAMGTALFGKAYQEMLPMLNEGSEGIEKSLARFSKLKGVISDEDLKGAKDFGDQLKDLSFVTKGFQMTIAKELVPVLSPLLESFIQWAAVNKKLIGNEVKKVVKDLVVALKQVDWKAFLNGIRGVFDSVGWLIDKVGGLRNALIILALIMNAQTIMAVFGLVGAFGRLGLAIVGLAFRIPIVASVLGMIGTTLLAAGRAALMFGRALLLSPLGIVLAIAAAAYLIYRNWDTLKSWFATFVGWLSGQWSSLVDSASELGASVTARIVGAWDTVKSWFGGWFDGMDERLKAVVLWCIPFYGVAKTIIDNWEPLKTWFTTLFDWLGEKLSWVTGVAKGIAAAVGAAFGSGTPGEASTQAATSMGGPGAAGSPSGPLGSGAYNLGASSTANVGGSLTVNFKNAPPGMSLDQVAATNPRVPINANVGFRTLGNDMGF